MRYPGILNLWKRDPKTHKYIAGDWFSDSFYTLRNLNWIGTEKIDGMNTRVIWDGNSVRVGGRSDNAQMPVRLLNHLQEEYHPWKFEGYPPMIIYGEGYGAGIQKVGSQYIHDGNSFIAFDIMETYPDGTCRLMDRANFYRITGELGIPMVPIHFGGKLEDASWFVKEGLQSKMGDLVAEGLVLRPEEELFDRFGNRMIIKIKTNDFTKEDQS
jgi:hypothetical protein